MKVFESSDTVLVLVFNKRLMPRFFGLGIS